MITLWEIGLSDLFLSMLWFFLLFIWVWLLMTVFADIFRSDDLSGWGKALWTICVILFPYLGVFVYLIAQGKQMAERKAEEMEVSKASFDSYVRNVAANGGPADQIAKAKRLLDSGTIDEAEFEQVKRKALAA